MTETEYLNNHYPQDFLCIQDEFFPLPKGGKIDIEDKQISSTFTTADGSKRKDIIRKYKAASIKFSVLTQKDFDSVCEIITKIAVKIDIVHPIKYSHFFRKNSEFLYSGITLKLN